MTVWKRWSLRRRVTVAAALSTATVAVLLAVTMVGVAGFLLRRQVDNELRARAGVVATSVSGAPVALGEAPTIISVGIDGSLGDEWLGSESWGPVGPSGIEPVGESRPNGDANASTVDGSTITFDAGPIETTSGPILSRVIDPLGRTEIGSPIQQLPVTDGDLAVASGQRSERFDDVVTAAEHFRTLTVTVPRGPDTSSGAGRQLAVQVAKPVSDLDRALLIMSGVGLGASTLGLFIAALLAWWVSRSALRPVEAFASTVEHVTATGNLDVTVPADGANELRRLGDSFNELMASLAESRTQQRQLIADAGHELRTPLTSIRTNLELLAEAEAGGHPPAELAAILHDVHEQFEELSSLVADVVALARDDSSVAALTEVRLDRVVERAVDRARRRSTNVAIDLRTSPAVLDGRATLLERAILNVLDNAVKWSPAGEVVRVAQVGGRVVIDDHGPGIAVEDRPMVTERFWRAPTARSVPGSGLGLSIAAQVVAAHDGQLHIDTAQSGGTSVRFEFPGATPVGP